MIPKHDSFWMLVLCALLASSPALAQQERGTDASGLGSTATLESIGKERRSRAAETVRLWTVTPAASPDRALEYRFWPTERELKHGAAQLHFYRALTHYLLLPADYRRRLQEEWFSEAPSTDAEARAEVVDELQNLYGELRQLALSESLEWDHRWRELEGPATYAYQLHDVQESRVLARLLLLKIDHELAAKDYPAAAETIRDGYRLAAFVCSGETLIQQLVGIAIASVTRQKVEQAVQQPGAPNFYWALATVPRPVSNMQRSLQIELGNLSRLFPMLEEAEGEIRDEHYWNSRWEQAVEDLRDLGGSQEQLELAMVAAPLLDVEAARENLRARGVPPQRLDAMPPIQAVFYDASLELKQLRDDMEKTSLLPYHVAAPLIDLEEPSLREWMHVRRPHSVAATIASLLLPATAAARQAEIRDIYMQHRLMTVEALRMHAAAHEGKLPTTLAELQPVPALPNPFTGQPFRYQLRRDDRGLVVVLDGDVPPAMESLSKVQLVFPSP